MKKYSCVGAITKALTCIPVMQIANNFSKNYLTK